MSETAFENAELGRRQAQAGSASGRGRIIAVNRFYWPDPAATSQLLTDLMEHVAHTSQSEPMVITSRMLYGDPAARLAPSESRGGVFVRRVWTSRFGRHRLAGRMIDYASFYVSAFLTLLTSTSRDDVVLVTTDPPLFSVLAGFVARCRRARLVTWNHDLYPEVAAALGINWAGGWTGRLLRRIRNGALKTAVANIAISGASAERIRRELGSTSNLAVIENWCDMGIRPVPPGQNPLRAAWGLSDSFVIGYSGNLGRAHIPKAVADLLRRCRDIPGLNWVFIGEGAGMSEIKALASELPRGTVQIRPIQDRSELAYSLSVPDLHLVSLDPDCEGLLFPSKFYGIQAAGRPALYLGAGRSEIAEELERHGTGATLDPSAPETWRATVARLMADPAILAAMGDRARARHEARMRQPALRAWDAHLDAIARMAPPRAAGATL